MDLLSFINLGIDRRLYLKAGTYKTTCNIILADNLTLLIEDISDVFPSSSVVFECSLITLMSHK